MQPYFQGNGVTLYHGDAVEVMASLPPGSIGTVLTDPPYSSGGRRENARSTRTSMIRGTEDNDWIRGDAMSTQGFMWLLRMCARQWRRLLVPGGHALTFIDWRMVHNMTGAVVDHLDPWALASAAAATLETADLRQLPTVVWDKTYFGMGSVFRNQYELIVHTSVGTPRPPARRDVGNVIPCKPIRGGEHPTEKPPELLRTLLSVVADPTLPVLDTFAGSGSTLAAAASLGIPAIGIEDDERFAELSARNVQTVVPLLV